ncbi:MAG: hemolysin XhlA family protein [Helicobacteraceae bacterium]|jgi:hypothetical protein|nr:hemolysin XhlA family protein [Helicobacteraceae bacterium]
MAAARRSDRAQSARSEGYRGGRIDDTKIDGLEKKIDGLEELVREQSESFNDMRVSVARIEVRLDALNDNKKEIDGVKANQRWAVLAIVGAFLTGVVNFFFRGN